MGKAHILAEIRRVAKENGGSAPGKITFEKATGISEARWSGVYWARWGDALVEAGYQPNTLNQALPINVVLQHFALACREYKKVPTMLELRLYSKRHANSPSHNSFIKPFGNKAALINATIEFVGKNREFMDVSEFLPDLQNLETIIPTKPVHTDGWVYLLKSGRYYKIGRSDNIERRIKQISISLPEEIALAHVIKTDDPVGIEAYWHGRFEEKRAKGEWFDLDASDIKAFKRRKFQ